MTERELKQAELIEMLDGLNEHGIDCMRFWAGEYLGNEKYQASTPPERLKAIHAAETAEVEARAEEANNHYQKSDILIKIGKRHDYMKVLDKNSPYYKDFFDILNSPFESFEILALDCFALGCIATERDLKQKAKKSRKAAGAKS